jgi:AmmeMemoRadiSam system protein A
MHGSDMNKGKHGGNPLFSGLLQWHPFKGAEPAPATPDTEGAGVGRVAPGTEGQPFSTETQQLILTLARRALVHAARGVAPPEIAPDELPSNLRERRACFVTLKRGSALRGCVGHIIPREPLYRAIMESSRGAALNDSRFPPVGTDELPGIQISVSVLWPLQPIEFSSPEDLLGKLRPGQDGVALQIDHRMATFLPQVWGQIPDRIEFLNRLSEKAGCDAGAWRRPGVRVLVYRADSVAEPEAHPS